ncbi:MAG: hypothetical protein CUN56_03270 [Phototrophicales bacterium]|nr:MAG: hypothetical protein CUN56_03270 [Phototrophicales bacterium]RMG73697.1 MAG: hypothetical protein D6711_10380 [Chloroflexota bacterium]
MTEQMIEDEIHYCAIHPDVETELRCNKCDRYMCARCAVQTPVGYRCRECVRQHDDKFFNATPADSWVVFGVTFGMMAVFGLIFNTLFSGLALFMAIILGFPAGAVVGELVMKAINKRKGRNHWQIALAGVIIGALLGGFLGAALQYPDEFRDVQAQIQALKETNPAAYRQYADLYPSQTNYALQNTLSLGMIVFVGLSGYAVYLRMKP